MHWKINLEIGQKGLISKEAFVHTWYLPASLAHWICVLRWSAIPACNALNLCPPSFPSCISWTREDLRARVGSLNLKSLVIRGSWEVHLPRMGLGSVSGLHNMNIIVQL